jgi:dihydroorotase-like cyclic amidohydrolase
MWEAAWAHKLSRGKISRSDAVKLVSTNVEDLFNLPQHASSSSEHLPEFVAYEVRSVCCRPAKTTTIDNERCHRAIRSSLALASLQLTATTRSRFSRERSV